MTNATGPRTIAYRWPLPVRTSPSPGSAASRRGRRRSARGRLPASTAAGGASRSPRTVPGRGPPGSASRRAANRVPVGGRDRRRIVLAQRQEQRPPGRHVRLHLEPADQHARVQPDPGESMDEVTAGPRVRGMAELGPPLVAQRQEHGDRVRPPPRPMVGSDRGGGRRRRGDRPNRRRHSGRNWPVASRAGEHRSQPLSNRGPIRPDRGFDQRVVAGVHGIGQVRHGGRAVDRVPGQEPGRHVQPGRLRGQIRHAEPAGLDPPAGIVVTAGQGRQEVRPDRVECLGPDGGVERCLASRQAGDGRRRRIPTAGRPGPARPAPPPPATAGRGVRPGLPAPPTAAARPPPRAERATAEPGAVRPAGSPAGTRPPPPPRPGRRPGATAGRAAPPATRPARRPARAAGGPATSR